MTPKRRDASAGLFHVYTHCVWAAPALYRDDVDRLEFLRRLAQVTRITDWNCIAYCLMKTHYHLIVRVGDAVLPRSDAPLEPRICAASQPPTRSSRPCPVQAVRITTTS